MKRSVRWMGIAVVTMVVVGVASPGRARAEHYIPGLISTMFFSTPAGAAALVTAVGNSVSLAGRSGGSKRWRIAGYVAGAFNLVAGAMTIGLSAGNIWTGVGAGLGNLALGALNIGLSVYGSTRKDSPVTRISLVPVTGQGAGGRWFAGAGVRIAGF